MFGSVTGEVLTHLEFALDGVIAERGHKLEPNHNDPQLVAAEDHIAQSIRLLTKYLERNK